MGLEFSFYFNISKIKALELKIWQGGGCFGSPDNRVEDSRHQPKNDLAWQEGGGGQFKNDLSDWMGERG